MNDQLQELLGKVYEEGVAKANAKAQEILDEANSEAQRILSDAKAQAATLVQDAEKQAGDLKSNTEGDLKIAASHSLSVLKQKITDLVLSKSVDAGTKASFADASFVQELIKATLEAFKESSGRLSLSKSLEGQLEDAFIASLKTLFDGKLQVDFDPQIRAGFSISPADGSYKLSFSDEDFANLFKHYLRPRTAKILFDS